MKQTLLDLLEMQGVRAGAVAIGAFLAAYLIEWLFVRVFRGLTQRTQTDLDDEVVEALRPPVFVAVVLVGLWLASLELDMPRHVGILLYGTLKTVAVLIVARAGLQIGGLILKVISRSAGKKSIVQPRTLPIFDMLMKLVVMGLAIYFFFLAWHIDVTAWLASAGIIGIAVGFAAKDTLANLFAGIFIIADAPYKVGDFIRLEDGLRGRVTSIGMRSTRILTRDDIEITVPNAVIGNSQLINETGGPYIKQRSAVRVSAAYGSDIDAVREVLLSCAKGVPNVAELPEPEVRFIEFGGSGLEFQLLVWIDDPARRDRAVSDLNVKVYKAFAEAGLEIPYSKHDVYIKEMARGAFAARDGSATSTGGSATLE